MIVSGYGRTGAVPQENVELTHVTLGTPMGEVLRRYWQPVCLSSDIDELPKFAKILGEELVAFRDKRGRVGVLDAHCAHRGTSLVVELDRTLPWEADGGDRDRIDRFEVRCLPNAIAVCQPPVSRQIREDHP